MQIAVLVVDHQRTMAEALAAGLAVQNDLHLVGTATSGSQAVAIASSRRVDVAIVDTDLGHEDGIYVGRKLRQVSPATQVVHLSGSGGDVHRVAAALQDGARGWVGKEEPMRELLAAVRGAQEGQTRLPPAMMTMLLENFAPEEPGPLSVLTVRQREILQGLVDGLSRAAIGERLFLAKNTVRTHIQQLLSRLGAHSTLEAVAIAREAGMRVQPRSLAAPSGPDHPDRGADGRTARQSGQAANV